MFSRHIIRGRKELSQTTTTDVVLLLITIAVVFVRLHDNNLPDIGVLLGHVFAHTFTAILAFIVLKFTVASSNLLRMLQILYVLVALADIFLLLGFVYLAALHDHKHSIDAYYAGVHIVLAVMFVGVDLVGAFFVDLSYNYVESLVYADNGSRLYAVANGALMSRNFTESSPGRIGSVHITAPTSLSTSGGKSLNNAYLNV